MSDDLDALAEELADLAPKKKEAKRSPRDERIIAGFEDIQAFVDEHGRAPRHGADLDIFERLYAVRLDRLRALDDCSALLEPLDRQNLLAGGDAIEDDLDDDALVEALSEMAEADDGVLKLTHVPSRSEKRVAEEIANRTKCEDFERFRPAFDQVQRDLEQGLRETRPFQKDADIHEGDWFVVGGQKALVAEVGEGFVTDYGRKDSRLRVIYDNQTESDILLRSLQRALYKDEAGRRITEPAAGPLFASESVETDRASGTIYVLRSRSDHPVVEQHREIIHKIGVTRGKVAHRIANAEHDPTFLMAPVDVVATYQLFNMNSGKFEKLIHRMFSDACLDIELRDRFGRPAKPREWFFVPFATISQAIEAIRAGEVDDLIYDPRSATLTRPDHPSAGQEIMPRDERSIGA